tara:strand:+ start:1870 stop:2310 length:441 start_codon:yes stop_codon:yes gene_type:complete
MIAEDINKYSDNNLFIMPPIKNTLINQGLFHKILYSNYLFTSNGLYIKIKFNNTKYLSGRLIYNIADNTDTLNKIINIENYILNNINTKKKIYHKIYDQIKNGNIKSSNSNNNIILKISGIWENENSLGISYKIISITDTLLFNDK